MLSYQQHYQAGMQHCVGQHKENFTAAQHANVPVRCHYPWCGHQSVCQPALPMWQPASAAPPVIKRVYWDCGTHNGAEETIAGMCHDLTIKCDFDKCVRTAVGLPYTHLIKSRCVMCTDVAEAPPHCPQAMVWFVVQWTEHIERAGEFVPQASPPNTPCA